MASSASCGRLAATRRAQGVSLALAGLALFSTGSAVAQSASASLDRAAIDRALAPAQSELNAACGRALPLRIDTASFVSHPPKPSERDAAAGITVSLSEERLAALGTAFSGHMGALCRKDAALAGKVRSLIVRSYEQVAAGKQDSANIYVDRESVGSRFIFSGKAGLRRGYTVYHFEDGVLSAYCDYGESCTETDLRGVPGLGTGTGTAINSDEGGRGGEKTGGGCVAVDGEQICATGSLGFAAAVESGDCSKAKSTRIAVACRQRLQAVKSFPASGCAIADAHEKVVQQGSAFGGHTPNAFFVALLKRLQACKDAAQLRRVLDARWQPDFRTLRIGGAGYEDETALHAKIRGSVVAACSALRPAIDDAQLTGLLYHCAAAADGSLASYPWSTRQADEARLRAARAGRIEQERRGDAAMRADFERRRDLPMAQTYCRGTGRKQAACIMACRKNFTCR